MAGAVRRIGVEERLQRTREIRVVVDEHDASGRRRVQLGHGAATLPEAAVAVHQQAYRGRQRETTEIEGWIYWSA